MGRTAKPAGGPAAWRVGLWLVLLLAAFGALQYAVHARRVWSVLAQPDLPGQARVALHGMLGWDLGYFAVAAALVVFCAAGILRQGWSRPVLRVALSLLALGLVGSGAVLLHHWHAWSAMSGDLPGARTPQGGAARAVHLSLGFDVGAIALLAWLVWRLGHPAVRAQFRRR